MDGLGYMREVGASKITLSGIGAGCVRIVRMPSKAALIETVVTLARSSRRLVRICVSSPVRKLQFGFMAHAIQLVEACTDAVLRILIAGAEEDLYPLAKHN